MSLDVFEGIEEFLPLLETSVGNVGQIFDAENETAPLDDAEFLRRKQHLDALVIEAHQINQSGREERRALLQRLETTTRNYLELQRQCNYVASEWQKIKEERDALKADVEQMKQEKAEQEQKAKVHGERKEKTREQAKRQMQRQKRKFADDLCETPCLSPERSEGLLRRSKRHILPTMRNTMSVRGSVSSLMNAKISI